MIRLRLRPLVFLLLLSLLTGCAKPAVRKQRYYKSGLRYFQEQRYSEAAIQFSNALQVDHDFAEARYQLAQCYLKQGTYSAAFAELVRTLEIKPDLWAAQVDTGSLFLASREYDKAAERASLVLKNVPDDIGAHTLMANVLAAQDKPDQSLVEMQKAIAVDPNRASSWLDLAEIQGRFRPQDAEASFFKAISLDPASRNAVMLLGNYYRDQKRYSDAETQYRRAIEMPPKDQEPRAALARLYLEQNDRAHAELVLQEAKQAAPDDPEVYRMFGDYLVGSGQFNRAVFEFASLHRLHPKDTRITKNYIALLIPYRRLLEATQLTDQILAKNDKDVDAKMFRADVLTRQGRTGEAIDLLGKLVNSEPDNARAHYLLGDALLQVGDAPRAEDEWREALRLRPDMNEARQALAVVAMRRGQSELLGEMIDALIQAEPSNPKWYVFRAASELAREHKAEAEADYQKAISVAPADPMAYCAMGNLRFTTGNLPDAEKYYELALQKDPNYVDALQGLMAIYMQQKQDDKALARVDAQIMRAPQKSAYYTLRGTLLLTRNDLDGAIAALAHATQLNKNDVDAFALLGQAYSMRGSVPEAIAAYQRSVESNPYDARSYVLLGGLEYGRNDIKRAQQMYEKALGVEPDYPLAANNLAYIMLERGENLDVAASLAQVARRGMPEEPSAADTLAWAYYQKGAYGLSIDLLQDALRTAPNNPTYHYHLGLAMQRTRQWDQARDHLRKALELNDSHAAEIRKALQDMGSS